MRLTLEQYGLKLKNELTPGVDEKGNRIVTMTIVDDGAEKAMERIRSALIELNDALLAAPSGLRDMFKVTIEMPEPEGPGARRKP